MAGANTYFGHDAHGAHPPPLTIPRNAMPPHSMTPNSMTPNSTAPNPMPPNAMAPNSMPPNAMVPNSMAPNSMPLNSTPPDSMRLNSMAPNPMPPNAMPPNSMPPTPTTPGGGSNLFSQPPSRAKVEFQNRLEARIDTLRVCGLLSIVGETQHLAHALTESIDAVRKSRGLGFLPDNQHWKDLEKLLSHDMFVVCLATKHWTARYLACADTRDMEKRITAHKGMPGPEISDQANRKANAPDPQVGTCRTCLELLG